MQKMLWPAVLAACAALAPATPVRAAAATPHYHLLRTIPVEGEGGWDYLTLDSHARRLYIARSTHVTVVDIDAGRAIGDIPDTSGVHGVAIDAADGRGFTSNGRSNSVTIFDLKSLKKLAEVPVGAGPDCIIFDSASRRVFTFNGGGGDATAIDARTGKVVGTVPLPGRPEFAVSDGKGHLYNNIEDKSEIAAINSKSLKVENVWPLAPGEGPSGIAMDTKRRLLFSVCDNQKMAVMDANTGRVVATPIIGNGPDAAGFDAGTGLAFSSNGQDGTLTVVREGTGSQFEVVATVPTQTSARTMALDEKTHHVFTVAAQYAPGGQGRRRNYVPGSFVVLEYAP